MLHATNIAVFIQQVDSFFDQRRLLRPEFSHGLVGF
jgi:hypothetical protein